MQNEEYEKKEADCLGSDGEIDVDKMRAQNKSVGALVALDHYNHEYEAIRKDFYREHAEISALPSEAVSKLLRDLDIKVYGELVPKPIIAFAHLSLD